MSGDDVVESAKVQSQLPARPVSEKHDEPQHSSLDENDDRHEPMQTTNAVRKLIYLIMHYLLVLSSRVY